MPFLSFSLLHSNRHASGGTGSSLYSALIAIVVLRVLSAAQPVHGQNAFITTWETTTPNESITIPTKGSGYDFNVDWGDGNQTTGITGPDPDPSHTYTSPGTYTVEITLNVVPGGFSRIYLAQNSTNAAKLQSIEQWGDPRWQNMEGAFAGASDMTYNAPGAPALSSVSNMGRMFAQASSFNGDISGWDVSSVTSMREMFVGALNFNADISGWDVSSVTDMKGMFNAALSFNADISGWDVSNVTSMRVMFSGAVNFNQPIGSWDVSSVTNMAAMFNSAASFNQDLGGWDVTSVDASPASFEGFLVSSGLSTANYDALLNGWSALTLTDGLTFDAGTIQYTSAAETARQSIIDDDNWTINDGGLQPTGPARDTLYVNAGAPAPGDGQSWGSAYPALQDAVDQANVLPGTDYEIWVAEGTYYSDDDNVDNDGDGSTEHVSDADESFRLEVDSVKIYGGFSGGETSRSARDPDNNEVILSGDIEQDDDPFEPNTDSDSDGTTYTQTDHIRGTNATHVLVLAGDTGENITSTTVLDGFTVTAGLMPNNFLGAGLLCRGNGSGNECSPTLRDLTFEGNFAPGGDFAGGGGISLFADQDGISNPTIENVTFRGNAAIGGGGLEIRGEDGGTANPTLTDCSFVNNAAETGGALSNLGPRGTANPTIQNTIFRENTADDKGGALNNFASGASGEASPTFDNVTFENNRGVLDPPAGSELGGGAIWNNAFEGGTASPQISNSTFTGNQASPLPSAPTDSADGGAIYSTSDSTTTGGDRSTIALDIDNTTFENNFAERTGGAIFSIAFQGGDVQSTISGTEFIDNTAGGSGALFIDGFRGSGAANTPPLTTNNLSVTNTTFSGNQAVDTEVDASDNVIGRKSEGGAIGVLAERGGQVNATIEDIVITGGSGQDANFGGAVHVASDTTQNGALASLAEPTFRNVVIRNVSAEQGGAISVIGDEEEARPRFENVTISGSEATLGGAIDVMGQAGNGNAGVAEPVFVNSTITGNSASRGGAVYDSTSGTGTVAEPTFVNTILWGNTASGSGSEIYNTNDGATTIDYSIVEGGDAAIANGSAFGGGTGNLNQDPLFNGGASLSGSDGTLATVDDSLNITSRSPAVDAGLNDSVSVSTDLAGANRVQDLDGDETATVNMGAYETAQPAQPGVPEPFGGPVASATGAALRGSVNPSGAEVTQVRFRLSPVGSDRDTTIRARALGGDLTGRTRQTVQGMARRLAPDTEYEAQLVATNDKGTETSDPVTFRTPPAPALQVGNGDQTLPVRLTAESGLGQDSTVYVRAGGAGSYSPQPVAETGGDPEALEATVPESAISSRGGVDYYAAFEGPEGTFRLPAGSEATARERPLNLPVGFDTLSAPAAQAEDLFQQETYRMVSVPAKTDVQAALTETYGSYDPAEWRLLQWAPSGGSGQYREFPNLNGSAFEPGKAFWLVTKRGAPLGLKSGTTVDASTPQSVRLEPGWNQLGTPFGISVPWSAVRDTSGLGSAVGDPLTYREDEYQQSTALAPWQGYFVFNAASEPDTLLIPPVEAGGSNSQSTTRLAAGPGAAAKTNGGYTLQISARGNGSTSRAVLGLHAGAKAGRDTLDVAQPPPVTPAVQLSAVEATGSRNAVPHAKSVKPAGGNGQSWSLRLRRPTRGDTPSEVRLDWSETGSLPKGHGRYVLDRSTKQRVTPGKTVSLTKGETRRLKVIVGTERYAKNNSAGVSLQAYKNELRGNYPNPFDEQTTLQYTLQEERSVTITIYNVLGQRVRTLVDGPKAAGLHQAKWEGTNRYGNRVGSGVYFVRMEAGDFTASEKMVLVR